MMNLALFPYDENYPQSGLITDVPDTPEDLKRAAESWDITPKIRNRLIRYQEEGAEIEFLCLSKTRGKGYPKCEVCMTLPDGSRAFSVLKQIVRKGDRYGALAFNGVILSSEALDGKEKKRNGYIADLYKETKVTQTFLSHLFGLSQSRISAILKKAGVKHPKR